MAAAPAAEEADAADADDAAGTATPADGAASVAFTVSTAGGLATPDTVELRKGVRRAAGFFFPPPATLLTVRTNALSENPGLLCCAIAPTLVISSSARRSTWVTKSFRPLEVHADGSRGTATVRR